MDFPEKKDPDRRVQGEKDRHENQEEQNISHDISNNSKPDSYNDHKQVSHEVGCAQG